MAADVQRKHASAAIAPTSPCDTRFTWPGVDESYEIDEPLWHGAQNLGGPVCDDEGRIAYGGWHLSRSAALPPKARRGA